LNARQHQAANTHSIALVRMLDHTQRALLCSPPQLTGCQPPQHTVGDLTEIGDPTTTVAGWIARPARFGEFQACVAAQLSYGHAPHMPLPLSIHSVLAWRLSRQSGGVHVMWARLCKLTYRPMTTSLTCVTPHI